MLWFSGDADVHTALGVLQHIQYNYRCTNRYPLQHCCRHLYNIFVIISIITTVIMNSTAALFQSCRFITSSILTHLTHPFP